MDPFRFQPRDLPPTVADSPAWLMWLGWLAFSLGGFFACAWLISQ